MSKEGARHGNHWSELSCQPDLAEGRFCHFLDRMTSASSVSLGSLLQRRPQGKREGISEKVRTSEKTEVILENDRDPGEALPVATANLSLSVHTPTPSSPFLPSSSPQPRLPTSFLFKENAVGKDKQWNGLN